MGNGQPFDLVSLGREASKGAKFPKGRKVNVRKIRKQYREQLKKKEEYRKKIIAQRKYYKKKLKSERKYKRRIKALKERYKKKK